LAKQFSVAVRNSRLDAIESTIGTSPFLRIYSGTPPANPAAALSGNTLLAEVALPSDWLAAASGGTKSKSGTWTDSSADGTGTASFYRIYASDGTTCHEQGTVTATGGGGDMTVDSTSFTAGQSFTINTWSYTEGNA